MRKVTEKEYYDHFKDKDAVISIPEKGIAEWTLRGSKTVIARSVERPSDEPDEYEITDYFIY